MALIVPVTFSPYSVLRNVSAQATTGQTDWIDVLAWPAYLVVTFNLTANAGTTPISTPSIRTLDPVTRDDTNDVVAIFTGAAITAASFHEYVLGPFTSVGTDSATADSYIVQNMALPATIGIRILNDRTTGDETYTYTLTAEFRR